MEILKYPCRKCSKEVEDGENGILCEGLCQSWYHASCVCVTDEEYDCLAASDDRWECLECVGDALPPHNSRDFFIKAPSGHLKRLLATSKCHALLVY